MNNTNAFTEQQVIDGAKSQYKGSVCLDQLDEAMRQKTLQEAIDIIVLDSAYWDGNLFR